MRKQKQAKSQETNDKLGKKNVYLISQTKVNGHTKELLEIEMEKNSNIIKMG